MKSAQKNYTTLHQIARRAKILEGIRSLLEWDQETHMPPRGAGIRAEQIQMLSGLTHQIRTGKEFTAALKQLIDLKTGNVQQEGLNSAQREALRVWRRDYLRETSLPQHFVEEFAKLTSQSFHIWEQARENRNFQIFLPSFEKIVDMCRKKADLLGYQDHPYDALLDEYEPEMTTKEVKAVFHPLKTFIQGLLQKIQSAEQVNDTCLTFHVSQEKQLSFAEKILALIEYSSEYGRLDLSSHPFSICHHPSDNRITTRIMPNKPLSSILTILHECGHAFYDMGLPIEHYGSPLGESVSLGIHESQSRWWETRIGMSKAFWEHVLPMMQDHFGGKIQKISLNTFWRAINKVEPSLIRTEADEVTYALHVILRFELELGLLEGTIAPKQIPDVWNESMHRFFGKTPKHDGEGCLQDIHWSMGGFGYFPTYTLGNLYASHLFEAFEKAYPNWDRQIAAGDFAFMKEWLRQEIYQHGRRYTAQKLLKKVTGKPFSSKAFQHYLAAKYSDIYGI